MSTKPNPSGPAANAAIDGSGQYLIFQLAGEEYGVDILKVQEIRGWSAVTRVPNMPAWVLGVLNLRGTIVPILDLRRRFAMPPLELDASRVVIVLTVAGTQGRCVIGVVVDGVSDVLEIPAEAIRPAPELGAAIRSEFIAAMATVGERTLVLLDADKLLTNEELGALEATRATAAPMPR